MAAPSGRNARLRTLRPQVGARPRALAAVDQERDEAAALVEHAQVAQVLPGGLVDLAVEADGHPAAGAGVDRALERRRGRRGFGVVPAARQGREQQHEPRRVDHDGSGPDSRSRKRRLSHAPASSSTPSARKDSIR